MSKDIDSILKNWNQLGRAHPLYKKIASVLLTSENWPKYQKSLNDIDSRIYFEIGFNKLQEQGYAEELVTSLISHYEQNNFSSLIHSLMYLTLRYMKDPEDKELSAIYKKAAKLSHKPSALSYLSNDIQISFAPRDNIQKARYKLIVESLPQLNTSAIDGIVNLLALKNKVNVAATILIGVKLIEFNLQEQQSRFFQETDYSWGRSLVRNYSEKNKQIEWVSNLPTLSELVKINRSSIEQLDMIDCKVQ